MTTTTEIKEILELFADDINNIKEKIEEFDIKINGRIHDKSIFDLMNDLSAKILELDCTADNTDILINRLTKRLNDLEQELKATRMIKEH